MLVYKKNVVRVFAICMIILLSSAVASNDDDDRSLEALEESFSYWGGYMGLFAGSVIFTGLISYFGVGEKLVEMMTCTAYKTFEAELRLNPATSKEVDENYALEADYAAKTEKEKSENKSGDDGICSCFSKYLCCCMDEEAFPYKRSFHSSFRYNLLLHRAFFGIELFKSENDGGCINSLRNCLVNWCCSCFGPKFFDFVFYLCNNNPILSMAFTSRANPLSRQERRNSFFIVNACSMFFAVYVLGKNISLGQRTFLNVFVVSPVMCLIDYSMFFIQACPCLYVVESTNCCCIYIKNWLNNMSQFISISIALGCTFIYFKCAQFARGADVYQNNGFNVLGSYMYEIFVVSNAIQAFRAYAVFSPFVYRIQLFKYTTIFEFGTWEIEKKINVYKHCVAIGSLKAFKDEAEFIESLIASYTLIPYFLRIQYLQEKAAEDETKSGQSNDEEKKGDLKSSSIVPV